MEGKKCFIKKVNEIIPLAVFSTFLAITLCNTQLLLFIKKQEKSVC
ncbi:hypothetical protein RK21_03594 [Pseudomonas plecoglossicida]|nr:hypothetical protein RK21_03594 [Pseudomonas plecoglossicida]